MDYKMFLELYNDKNKQKKKEENNETMEEEVKDIFDELDDFEGFEDIEKPVATTNDCEDDTLENTAKINTYEIKELINKNIHKITTDVLSNKPEKKKKTFLPWTTDQDFHLQRAFVNCSVLGFITMAIGYSQLFYIISHL